MKGIWFSKLPGGSMLSTIVENHRYLMIKSCQESSIKFGNYFVNLNTFDCCQGTMSDIKYQIQYHWNLDHGGCGIIILDGREESHSIQKYV